MTNEKRKQPPRRERQPEVRAKQGGHVAEPVELSAKPEISAEARQHAEREKVSGTIFTN